MYVYFALGPTEAIIFFYIIIQSDILTHTTIDETKPIYKRKKIDIF
jgi:hypothetical protein